MTEDNITIANMRKEEAEVPNFEKYLFPADIALIRCVDERQAVDNTNGVEIPGGTYGIIDAIKYFKPNITEEEAWKLAKEKGIPFGGHIDQHHGAKGCGYGRLVEEKPEIVRARENIPAADRLRRIQENKDGKIQTLLGDHHPTHAVINHRKDFSIDPDKAYKDKLGIFNFDKWAAKIFGELLGFDGDAFADHLEDVYKRTVTELTGITTFYEIQEQKK